MILLLEEVVDSVKISPKLILKELVSELVLLDPTYNVELRNDFFTSL